MRRDDTSSVAGGGKTTRDILMTGATSPPGDRAAGAAAFSFTAFGRFKRSTVRRLLWMLKVAVAVALVLNCSYPHRLQADPPSPCESVECFLAFQQEVFAYLFNAPFSEGDPWAYRLFDDQGSYVPITGVGAYSGRIFTEQAFSFECTTYLPVPLDFSSLPPEQQPTPEQIQTAIDEGLEFASVAGVVQTATAELPILGFTVSGTPTELGAFVSYFVVVGVLEADDPLIVGVELVTAPPIPPPSTPPGHPASTPPPTGRVSPVEAPEIIDPPTGEILITGPCDQCEADYLNAVGEAGYIRGLALAEADANYSTAVAAAETAWGIASDQAWATFDAARRFALAELSTELQRLEDLRHAQIVEAGLIFFGAGAVTGGAMLVSLVGSGPGMMVILIAWSAFVARLAQIELSYRAAKATARAHFGAQERLAQDILDAALSAAAATRDAAVRAAEAARAAAYRQAQGQFAAAVRAAWEAREACRLLHNCDPHG